MNCSKCGTWIAGDGVEEEQKFLPDGSWNKHTTERCLEVVLEKEKERKGSRTIICNAPVWKDGKRAGGKCGHHNYDVCLHVANTSERLDEAVGELVRLYSEATGNHGRVDTSDIHKVSQIIMDELCKRNTDAGDFYEKLESLKSVLKVIASGKAVDVESIAQSALDSIEEDSPKKFGELNDQPTFAASKHSVGFTNIVLSDKYGACLECKATLVLGGRHHTTCSYWKNK